MMNLVNSIKPDKKEDKKEDKKDKEDKEEDKEDKKDKKDKEEDKEDKKEDKEYKEDKKDKEDKEEDKKEDKEEDKKEDKEEDKEEPATEEPVKKSKKDEDDDPSLKKMKDLEKLVADPPRIPGLEVITVEPKATLAATKLLDMVISKLSDPKLSANIMDNIGKSVELSLENKINKIEYLKKDTEDIENHKDISKIISDIHNEAVKPDVTEINVKGGRKPFFTAQECSFF